MNLNNFLLGCQPWESRNNPHFSQHRPLMRDPFLKSWNTFMLITLLQGEDGRDRDILIIAPLPPRPQHYCSESLGPSVSFQLDFLYHLCFPLSGNQMSWALQNMQCHLTPHCLVFVQNSPFWQQPVTSPKQMRKWRRGWELLVGGKDNKKRKRKSNQSQMNHKSKNKQTRKQHPSPQASVYVFLEYSKTLL